MKSNKITGLSILGLMQTSCLLLLIFSLLPLLTSFYWLFDLFTHFRMQYLFIALVFAVGFLWVNKSTYVAMAALVVFINLLYVMPIYTKTPTEMGGTHGKRIKIFYANILTSNTEYAILLDQILTENPDIVVLQEIDELWLNHLDVLKTDFKDSIEVPSEDNFGTAIYSKIPITDYVIHYWSDFDIPNIEAELNLDGIAFQMIATHPLPPVNKRYFDARTAHFEATAVAIKATSLPSIVIGDLNTTIWSDKYQILETDTGLTNASNGFGFVPTWSTNFWPLMIPIDHCLVSDDFKVFDMGTGQGFGSDHLPLIVELGL